MVEPRSEIQRIERLMPLADAVACVDRMVKPVAPRAVRLGAALGRMSAAPVAVAKAHPSMAVALRDGFAVVAETTLDASSYAPLMLDAVPVEVGDPMPDGTDAVAPLDAVEMRGSTVQVVAPVAPGDGVLPAGADGEPGDMWPPITRRLRATDLATFAIFGVKQIEVREPRIRVAAAKPEPDAFFQAIVSMIARRIEAAGGVIISAPSLVDALEASNEDAVILVGGSGSGQSDHSVRELALHGRLLFHGVALTPGETAAFGMIEQRPVLVVPGRLDAALAVWLTLGCRMLARLADDALDDGGTPAVLARKITSTLGLAELVPVMREADGVVPLASGYLPLQALARADGFVIVPADREGFPAGATVEMRPLP
jgi:molybdopterin molybdotransferase